MKTALIAPRPLDALELPDTLDGRTGVNRASGRRQIAADNDLEAVRAWLARVAGTKTTFENYRKEAERLLLWSIVQLGKPLSSLTHEDLLVYQRFLADPQPRARWVSGGENGSGRKFAREDPRWRPFHGPLAASSQRQAVWSRLSRTIDDVFLADEHHQGEPGCVPSEPGSGNPEQ